MDWIANILLLIGLWLIGRKHSFGFILNAIGCLLYLFYFWDFNPKQYGVIVFEIVMIVFNMKGLWQWQKISSTGL